jgi:hypothetical protein
MRGTDAETTAIPLPYHALSMVTPRETAGTEMVSLALGSSHARPRRRD